MCQHTGTDVASSTTLRTHDIFRGGAKMVAQESAVRGRTSTPRHEVGVDVKPLSIFSLVLVLSTLGACRHPHKRGDDRGRHPKGYVQTISARSGTYLVSKDTGILEITLSPIVPVAEGRAVEAIIYVIDGKTNEIYARQAGKIGVVDGYKKDRVQQITLRFDTKRARGPTVRAEAFFQTAPVQIGAVMKVTQIQRTSQIESATALMQSLIQQPNGSGEFCVEICPHFGPPPNGIQPHCADVIHGDRRNLCPVR